MEANSYDVCVIGCGPGGFAAAMRAFDFGKRVCIIEGENVGGAGIMHGAMTSKTLWELSKDYATAAAIDRGYRASGLAVDFEAVRDTVVQAAKEKEYQILSQLESFSPRRHKGPGTLALKRGHGSFLSKNRVQVTYKDGTIEEVNAEFFVIATGSRPREFPGIPVDQERIINSDGILALKRFPKRFIIIGAGIIGCEYASMFSNFGQTKVHLLDRQSRIIPFEDDDISDFVSHNLAARGVTIHHNAILRAITKHPSHLEVVIDYEDGHSEILEMDVALISIGRRPNTERLNLEVLGIKPDRAGFIPTDESSRAADNIFAVGDVTGKSALYNVAEAEGRDAVKAMYSLKPYPLKYQNMSTIMFFNPEVAAVGLNEKKCRDQGIPYRVAYYSNHLVNRAIAMRRVEGFVKILVSDDGHERILGMRAAGPQASSTIMAVALLMDQNKGMPEIVKSIHPHPSITEGIQECLRLLLGKSVLKPQVFPEHMRITTWAPADAAARPAEEVPVAERVPQYEAASPKAAKQGA